MTSPSIAQLSVGLPRECGPFGPEDPFGEPWPAEPERWTSGIFKSPIDGPVAVTVTGLLGDGQADPAVHGGPDKAVCVYAAEHYPAWRRTLGLDAFVFGAFGENLTVTGLDEQAVCIGDVWRAGDVLLQVSQPRKPCWKLGRKWGRPSLTDEVRDSGRTGWYFRVLEPGHLSRGLPLSLVSRAHPAWTVAAANAVMHDRVGDAAALATLEGLSENWRTTLRTRLDAAASR